MMESKIDSSRGIDRKYEKWARELLTHFGPDVSYGSPTSPEKTYRIRNPVTRIRLLDEHEYEEEHSRTDCVYLEKGYEPPVELYSGLKAGSHVDYPEFFKGLAKVAKNTSLAFWRPRFHLANGVGPMFSPDYESEVIVCPSRICIRAPDLKDRLSELGGADIEKLLFRVSLAHEIGHHFTLSNFPSYDVRFILEHPDLNILEGLANWWAYSILGQSEKLVLAEFAIHQRVSYRHFLYFKHSDISGLLDIFFSGTGYDEAPSALSKIIGGKLNLNGNTVTGKEKFDGLAMDWSGKGGGIIVGEEIKALATMNQGIFITPRIQHLIGRFPENVIIVANEIITVTDYEKLPDNVIVLSKDEADLSEIIEKHLLDDEKTRIRSILDDAGLTQISDSFGE